jgi:hypothetical protein
VSPVKLDQALLLGGEQASSKTWGFQDVVSYPRKYSTQICEEYTTAFGTLASVFLNFSLNTLVHGFCFL